MKRLGALQEGALATLLYYFLEDGAWGALASWILQVADSNVHCLITEQLGRTLIRMGIGRPFNTTSLAAMLCMTPFRSCSRLDDETLALAPVMRLEVTHLLKAGGDERMVRFLDRYRRRQHFYLGRSLISLDFARP